MTPADTTPAIRPYMTSQSSGPRPGDEIREAQHAFEDRLKSLITAFNNSYGVSITTIHIEYVHSGTNDGVTEGDTIVRLVLET